MPVTLPVGQVVFWSVLLATPLALRAFASRRRRTRAWTTVRDILVGYRWHVALFAFILVEKNWIDALNDPVRGVFGDKTYLIQAIEGDATYHLQQAFEAQWLTAFLNVHYLWAYVFLNYFSVILFAHRDDRELANLVALNYSVIYVLAIPFYIFFNVQVTSDAIPGMKALLYHAGPGFYSFFLAHDPLDNAFPSLHIAIPFGLILVTWWTMRRRGYTIRDWEHRRYLWFMILNTALFAFSILYLGIHWITDIPGGLLVGLLGALVAEELEGGIFGALQRLEARVLGGLRRMAARTASVWRRLVSPGLAQR